jgi:rubrerythrin
MKVKNMINLENNNYSNVGDFVKCLNCNEIMLTDIGLDHCPSCGIHDSLFWIDKEHQEATEEDLIVLGYEITE